MEAVRTLASAHPPTNGAQRGPDTHSVILLEIMRAPGTATRLFAEMPLQSWTVLARVTRLRAQVKIWDNRWAEVNQLLGI